MRELRSEVGSHLFASLADWSFSASYGELVGALHYAAFIAAHTDEKRRRSTSVTFPWSKQAAVTEEVSAEDRVRAEEYLAAHSAIRS